MKMIVIRWSVIPISETPGYTNDELLEQVRSTRLTLIQVKCEVSFEMK